MRVFGLEGDVYRLARLAGRAVPEVALARFELVRRVDGLRAAGLTVAVALAAVGLSRASHYRWRRQARGGIERRAPRSRRPHRPRRPCWEPTLVEAIERLRLDFPMWAGPSWWCCCAPGASPSPKARCRRVAYHFHRTHPGDVRQRGQRELVRVPAEQVLHVFHPIAEGQIRGVPWVAPVAEDDPVAVWAGSRSSRAAGARRRASAAAMAP
jgi:hypothetical protein